MVRPGKPVHAARQKAIKKGPPSPMVRAGLYAWRRKIKQTSYPRTLWGPQAILDEDTCELLSSVGPITSKEHLASLIKTSWARWDKLGHQLFTFLHALPIPPLISTTGAGRKADRPVPLSHASSSSAIPSAIPPRSLNAVPPIATVEMSNNTTSHSLPSPVRVNATPPTAVQVLETSNNAISHSPPSMLVGAMQTTGQQPNSTHKRLRSSDPLSENHTSPPTPLLNPNHNMPPPPKRARGALTQPSNESIIPRPQRAAMEFPKSSYDDFFSSLTASKHQ